MAIFPGSNGCCQDWSCFGAVNSILLLEFAAPALDLGVIENLANNAAEQTLDVRMLDFAQGADGLLLVSFVKVMGAVICLELLIKSSDFCYFLSSFRIPLPQCFEQRALFSG